MSTEWDVPLDRVYLLNPGQSLDVGDRKLAAFRPPLFDSPATTGFIDTKSGAMFSSDCFGAHFETIAAAPANPGFIGPDQRALEELLASFAPDA